ncbi:siroheme synthase [Methanococcus vannielii SB]|uniref:precorrin-2 dehydrogenase n=1 Tax=Methanococcus vannielii (strain ATCC 35089 / DSM 1224 / JCM 13029 / OCM 148 / SB) TaxID=406327 RepID=A6UR79_METVS|nr:bifunctional precorrin-2 dehydrogenase/sirohydrochlorin ferrochelatase [Methanococcus vannielii]ABR55001.1 siroheme synthase [Methanococcus vannielii SB]
MMPVFLDLKGFNVLIFGFGNVGKRRFEKFLKSNAKLTVYSEKIEKEDILNYPKVKFFEENVNNLSNEELYSIIKNFDIIITAVDKKNNNRIVEIATYLKKYINSSTFEDKVNLVVPACFEENGVSFAIYTGGKSPIVAREVRKVVQNYLKNSEDNIEIQDKLRNFLKDEIKDQELRKKILEKVFSNKQFKLEFLELIEKHR